MQEVTVKKVSLKFARTEVGLSQKVLSERAGIRMSTISACENGAPIRMLTAQALLRVINQERKSQGMDILIFEDMDWIISG